MSKTFRICIFIGSLLFLHSIFPITVGSDTAVSVESFTNFPAGEDNLVYAFAWMKNGFELADNTTTCTFGSVYPVSGQVSLNGGIITLDQDLLLKSNISISNWGSIIGNDHRVDLCSSITSLPEANFFEDTTVIFNSDLVLSNSIVFKGTCVLVGDGNSIFLDDNAALIVDSGASLELHDLELHGVKSTNVRCIDDTGLIILDSMSWIQEGNYTFSTGSILFVDQVSFIGSVTFSYESSQTSTITAYTQVTITDDMYLSIGRVAENAPDPLYFEHATSVLKFDKASWIVTSFGMQITNGTILFDNNVDVDVQSTSSAQGIIFGDTIDGHDATIICKAGTVVSHKNGHITYNNYAPDKIVSTSSTAHLIREENSYIVVNTDVIIPEVTVELVSENVYPLIVDSGASLQYDKSLVVLPNVAYDLVCKQVNAYTYLLTGANDQIFFNKGILPLYLQISGLGNLIQGNGGISGYVTLADQDSELQSNISGSIGNILSLNGGTLTLLGRLGLDTTGIIAGPGTVNLNSLLLDLGQSAATYSTPILWEGTSGKINFNDTVSLSSTWTISGSCTLNGNGNTLVLLDGGEIALQDGASLTLKQLKIKGVKDSNIRCLSDNALIVWENSDWFLDNDFTYTHGAMYFNHNNSIQGNGYRFTYDSAMTSSIVRNAEFKCYDVQLAIGRKTVDSSEPLYLIDRTAMFTLDDSTLEVSAGGMRLDQGMIGFFNNVNLEMNSTTTQNGLEFGNDAGTDTVILNFFPGTTTYHVKGHMIFNMSTLAQFASSTLTANFIREANTIVVAKRNVHVKDVTATINPPAVILTENGAIVSYENAIVSLPGSDVLVTGTRYDDTTILLTDGGSFEVMDGSFGALLRVDGSGNTITGNASLGQPTILQNSTASCTMGVHGTVNNISLNGGAITLSDDLNFTFGKYFVGSGMVNLADKSLNLSSAPLTAVNNGINWTGAGGSIEMHAQLSLASTWTFNGSCEINGHGFTLDLGATGQIYIADGAQLTLRDMFLKNVSGTNITCLGDTSVLELDNVYWVQDDDYIFDTGSLLIQNEALISGGYTFLYTSSTSSVINKQSELHISDHSELLIDSSDVGYLYEPFIFEDGTALLHLDNCSLTVTGYGAQFTTGRVINENDVAIDIYSTSTLNGLTLGNGTLAGDLIFELRPGASVRYLGGHVVTNITNMQPIVSRSKTARVIRSANSVFHLMSDVLLSDITLNVDVSAVLTIEPGKTLSFADVGNETVFGDFDIVGARYSSVGNLLAGSDNFVFLSRGAYPLLSIVANAGNSVLGNGNIIGPIIFFDSNAQLIWGLNGCLLADLTLNGGLLTLSTDLVSGPDIMVSGPGEINIQGNRFVFGPKKITIADALYWNANGGTIEMGANIDLENSWTFSGICTLQGNGNILKLIDAGSLIVEDGSQLTLKNMVVQNITGTQIKCLNDASVLILDNVTWLQSDDYIFDTGALEVKNNVKVRGGKTFAYQTSLTSTIAFDSKLKFDTNCTFSYDPTNYVDNLLEMIDESSELFLNNASLHITVTGMQLTHGLLRVNGTSSLSCEGADGITLGNGVSADDCMVVISLGSTLSIDQGTLNYRNTSTNAWRSENNVSTLYMQANTHLFLYEDLDIGVGRIIFANNTELSRTVGKELFGTIDVLGEVLFTNI